MSCYVAYILDNTADQERAIEDIAAKRMTEPDIIPLHDGKHGIED